MRKKRRIQTEVEEKKLLKWTIDEHLVTTYLVTWKRPYY